MIQNQAIEGFRLSPQQKRLWVLQERDGTYHTQSVFLAEGEIDRERLRWSFQQAVSRHEVFRTIFHRLVGMDLPIQVVQGELPFGYGEIELAERDNLEAVSRELLQRDREAGLDLENGPLVRLTLARVAADRHLLCLTTPTLCGDARTHENLIGEVGLFYEAAGDDAEIDAALQYVDFSEWQHELLISEEAGEGREFWRNQLPASLAELTELRLPFENGHGPAVTCLPGRVSSLLEPMDLARVERLAREQKVSTETVLLSAWLVLLSRLGLPEDLCIGRAHAGRKYEDLAGAHGLFARCLPLRFRLDAAHRFTDTLAQVERTLRQSEEWQEYFSWDDLTAGDAHLPYGFEYRGTQERRQLAGARLSLLHEQSRLERFALQLRSTVSSRGLELEIWHDAVRVHAEEAELLLDRLMALLGNALGDPATRISELGVLGTADRRLLAAWNDTALKVEERGPVHRRFEAQAARTPEAEALISGSDRLTYRELNERANRLARHLIRMGAQPGCRVVLALERSMEQVVTLLAAWKAGAAFVPLDPLQPAERLARMLEDVAIDGTEALVVTTASLVPHLPGTVSPVLVLDEIASGLAAESAVDLPLAIPAEAPAYVIFTSGSTGRPKGAVIRHSAVANLAEALRRAVYRDLGELDAPLRVSVNAPLAFDGSIKQIIQLFQGHTLVLVPEEMRPDARALVDFLREGSLDVLDCTPAQLGAMLDAGLLEGPGRLPRLTLVGGEKIPLPLWERLAGEPERIFYNVYGPTECTVDATVERIGKVAFPSIGRPIANVRAYVMDERQQPVPPEVWGELLVGGDGVSLGYLGRPDLTAERFLPDPFAAEPGGRLYRTGDRVRLLRDGHLLCQGRLDHQVKLRGFRIELGEIEAVLAEHPGVTRAVAQVREDVEGVARLVAYVAPRRTAAGSRELHRLPNGLRVAHQNQNETEYLYREIFLNRCYALHGVTLPPDACVFDVGANIGMFTLFVHQECTHPQVYAFEPLPAIYDSLSANCELYTEQVKLYPFGLSDQERKETFTYYPRYSMMSGQSGYARPEDEVGVVKRFLENQQASGIEEARELLNQAEEILAGRFQGEEVEVRLRRLSDVIRQERVLRIDLLKIDVQRAEMDVLHGLDEEHWPLIRQVVLEVHDAPGDESEGRVHEIRHLLERHGFSVVIEQDELLTGTDRYNVYAVRPDMKVPANPAGGRSALSRWLESGGGAELTGEALRDLARRRLPDYMVPSAIVVIPHFPLNRNGKIDRAALPSPEELQPAGSRSVVSPRNPVEEVLAGIWADLLGQPQIGIDESFFELGGHSLLATQLVSRVREAFQVELPLRALFEGPTIAELGERVQVAFQAGAGLELPGIQPVPRDRDLPLSFAQQRLWFLWQLEPESPAYNNPKALRIRGALDVAALGRTLDEIVRRHEVLRTTFPAADGRPVQRIDAATRFSWTLTDLSSLPALERMAQAESAARTEALRPFDLARDLPIRVQLLRLGAEEHLLLFTLHHIASDAWSLGVLVREASALYEAFAAGHPSPLPELPVQYADMAQWQREWLQGELLERELAFWREELAGVAPALELPLDRSRPRRASYRGDSVAFALTDAQSRALRELSQRRSLTTFMTFLTVFQVLLGRAAAQDDVCVGTPIAGRRHLETEGLIGFFVNTLVLRCQLQGEPTFGELFTQIQQRALQAYAHQDLPFERLVDELKVRDSQRSTLFQVMLALQNAPMKPPALPGLEMIDLGLASEMEKFDLSLTLWEHEGTFCGVLSYALDLFDRGTIERMASHLQVLLESAVADPGQCIFAAPLLRAAERHQILREWSGVVGGLPPVASFLSMFEAQVDRAPEAPALSQAGHPSRLSYAELDRRANRLAHRLRGLGVSAESRVAVLAERSPDLIVALLGTLKAGGVYVPLDPAYPQERLAFMLEDSGAAVLLTQERWADPLATARPSLVIEGPAGPQGERETRPALPLDSDQLAYVIYTSGSTGRPKGSMVSHGALARYAAGAPSLYGVRSGDRVLQLCSTSFDASLEEIVCALATGAELILRTDAMLESVTVFLETCREHGVTVLSLPTAYWHDIAAKLESEGLVLPECLRRVIIGGERALFERVQAWRRYAPEEARLINTYGLTESTIVSTAGSLTSPSLAEARGEISIGRPIPDTRTHVLDRRGDPVPIGIAGELHIGGELLARGYLGRPDLTAERFLPDPFSAQPGVRLYRTGDLARMLPDGRIEYAGRADRQVKVRGYRIEIEEIESRLLRHSAVESAVVLVREDTPGDKRIVAYVVPRPEVKVEPALLRSFLRETLPDYMVPGAFVALDALPVNPNGKLDRGALPSPTEDSGDRAQEAPEGVVEEILAGIWAEVLFLADVGSDDNFFALGGHSLLATQMVARVHQAFGVDLTLRTVFERPTLAALASEIEALLRRGAGPEAPPLLRAPRIGALPASFAQQRLWFLDQVEPGSAAYNIPIAQRLLGPLNAHVLEASLAEVVRRHESLRTTFAGAAGTVVLVIAPAGSWHLPWIDLSALPEAVREAEARRLAMAEAARPFDLGRGSVFRASLLRLAPEDHVALATMHHIASDGWSVGVFARELSALYPAFAAGRPSPLPELRVQYADYAAWQRSWLEGGALEADLAVWSDRLRDLPPRLELPTDRPLPARPSRRGTSVRFALPPDLARALRATGHSRGATPFMILLAAWQLLLCRLSGQNDICVGSPIAGRNRIDLEPLIGFFVNTLVLRTDLSGEPTFAALLARVREICLEAHVHQATPFEKLVERMAPQRSLSQTPLFQVMFSLQNTPAQTLEVPGLTVGDLGLASGSEKFDLSLMLWEEGGSFHGALSASTDLFDRITVERMSSRFRLLLQRAVAELDRVITELPLLEDVEVRELEREMLDVRGRAEVCVHAVFEEQVRQRSEAVALVAGCEVLTYGELDARAERIAVRLLRRGVGPEARIAVLLERSADLVAALLGVFKAGGVFVPLDPHLPAERLAFFLEDSGASVLLTHGPLSERIGHLPRSVSVLRVEVPEEPAADHWPRDRRQVRPEHLAYLIYTSGSTGRPKAVMVEHGSLATVLLTARQELGFTADDSALVVAPFSFDIFLFELLAPLLAGGRSVLAPVLPEIDIDGLVDLLAGVTRVHAVPSLMRQIVDAVRRRGPETWRGSLRTLFIGGDCVPVELLADLREVFPAADLTVLYGPTEATIFCTAWKVPAGEAPRGSLLGQACPSACIVLCDANGNPVPAGVTGEIWVGGPGVARGYLGRAELTARCFVSSPLGDSDARFYRTGDLARWRAEGLEFLGRADQQVKIRGFRIELGEIESALAGHPTVHQAAVVTRRDEDGDNRLVAYVVPVAGEALEAASLRDLLARRLPEYMVPSAFVLLQELPLTPHGKLDRRALPAPLVQCAVSEAGQVLPRGPIEEVLAAIWSELLRVEGISARSHFFELGGHSLLATRVMSRVREAFGCEVPLRALFEFPVLTDLARQIEAALRRGGVSEAPPIERAPRTAVLPASFAQQRLWFVDQLRPGSAAYNLPIAQHLVGPLDLRALEASLSEVVRRHETLRTTFTEADGQAVQVVAPADSWRLPVVDLSALSEDARTQIARGLAAEEAFRPFDLRTGPIFRASILHLAAEEHVVLLTVHHIAVDGWSIGILARELAALYPALAAGLPSPLPELPLQYADYAHWQRSWLQGEVLATEIDYWREHLRGAPPLLDLPTDRPRPERPSHRGAQLTLPIPGVLSRDVALLSRKEACTPFMTLLATFGLLLSRLAEQEDVVLGVATANRTRAEIEGLIGFFVNMLPLRLDFSGAPRFLEVLRKVREVSLGGFAHQEVPLEKLIAEVRPSRSAADAPLFQIAFGVQNTPGAQVELPGLRLGTLGLRDETVRFDLTVWIFDTGEGLFANWTYSTELFEASTIQRLHAQYVRLLESIVERPEAEIDTLEMVSAAERQERAHLERTKEASRHARLLQAQPKKLRLTPPNHEGGCP